MLDITSQIRGNSAFMLAMDEGKKLGRGIFRDLVNYHKGNTDKNGDVDFTVFYTGLYLEAYKQIAKHIPHVADIGCRRGCDHCCHLRVSSTVPEVVALYSILKRKWNKTQLENLRRRLTEYYQIEFLDMNHWVKNEIPCVFLDGDGACSIYNFRPLTCRAMTSAEPDKCREGRTQRKAISFSMDGNRKFMLDGICSGIDECTTMMLNQPVPQVELHNALKFLMDVPNSAKLWEDGINLFRPFEVTVGVL